jgi:hypothetical protein
MADFVFTHPELMHELAFQIAYECAEELATTDSKQVGLILPVKRRAQDADSPVAQMLRSARAQLAGTGSLRMTEEVTILLLSRNGFNRQFKHGPVIAPFVAMSEVGKLRTNPQVTTVIWIPAAAGDVDMSLVGEWDGVMIEPTWTACIPYLPVSDGLGDSRI